MEFLKALVEQDFGITKEEYDKLTPRLRYRQFQAIEIIPERLWLSIQASCAHYSEPRETLDDWKQYKRWEFALIRLHEGEEESEFVRVSDVLPEFASLLEIECYEQDVYAYVPSDLIEELYLALK